MTPRRMPEREIVESDDLKALANARGPCVSVALAIPDPLQIRARIRNGIRDLEKKMKGAGIDSNAAKTLAEPVLSLAADAELEKRWASRLLIYRSPELFRYFSLANGLAEFVSVGERFQIRPLLTAIAREQRFLLLALSRKHVKLFRCTHHSFEPVKLEGMFPESLEEWMNARMPDHTLENRSTGGPDIGAMKGVTFGTSSDRERLGKYLHHYFREVDTGLRRGLHGEPDALILAGVEEETAIYRRINGYGRLIDRAVHGSPDGMTPAELHQRAAEIIQTTFAPSLEKLLHDFEKNRGSRRVAVAPEEVVKAAQEGLVSGILLRDDAEFRGSLDPGSGRIRAGEDDLLNAAALMTLQYGGEAYSLPSGELPAGVESAVALLRA